MRQHWTGIDEEPIGVMSDIGNVDFTDAKSIIDAKSRRKLKQKASESSKRRNRPRFKHV